MKAIKEQNLLFIEPLDIQVYLNYRYNGEGEYATLLYENDLRVKVKFLKPLNIDGYEYDEVLIGKMTKLLTDKDIAYIFSNQKKFFKQNKEG